MGAGHAQGLYLICDTPVHRLAPQAKLVAAVCFVLVVVGTPRDRFWAFGGYAVLLAAVAALSRVPPTTIGRRMLVETPFVVFALLLPVIATGERVDVAGLSLSVGGLWAAWNILVKATLGVITMVLLAATTELRELLLGLERLRMPSLIVQIMSFMVRYGDLVTGEMQRMRIARESRGFVARDLRQVPVVARSAGALFIRCYERGERVHLAMLSRGYAGQMPFTGSAAADRREWALALALPASALTVAVATWALA